MGRSELPLLYTHYPAPLLYILQANFGVDIRFLHKIILNITNKKFLGEKMKCDVGLIIDCDITEKIMKTR